VAKKQEELMSECICSSCKNLKNTYNEDEEINEYECEFGFPSDCCNECSGEQECDETCAHYMPDILEAKPLIVECRGCGCRMEMHTADTDAGDVYCVECYLKMNK